MALLFSSYRKQTYILYFYQWMFWRCKLPPLHISWEDFMTFSSTEKRIEVNVRDIYFTGIGINQLLFYKFKTSSYAKCFHFCKLKRESSNENPKLKWGEFSKKIKILKIFPVPAIKRQRKTIVITLTKWTPPRCHGCPLSNFAAAKRRWQGLASQSFRSNLVLTTLCGFQNTSDKKKKKAICRIITVGKLRNN